MPMKSPEQPDQDRQIRVFISSTFRDMMRERDLLVKEVFPELRRKCAKRFVTFTEVDLRWGITEEQQAEGKVLPICLEEIHRSRPYFIGLLGERYGWIPDSIRPEVIAREPWLREHVQGRTSVTELEILHGVLNNPQMQHHAFFYFRDPAYVNTPSLTDDERRDMVERDIRADVERYGPAEANRRTEERKAKLTTLKQRIRDSKLPLAEPYANPKTLARLIRRQFNRLIDRLYPEDQTPDLLAQERMAHEAHAKNKLFACIDRPAHLAALNAFAAPAGSDGKGLVVTGESGGGKTALLAAWTRDWTRNHPEDFLFQHYFGATPDSTSPEGFLRRLLGELKSRFVITDEIPTDPEKLLDALPIWLAQTVGRGRIVLVLDGLNQVQGSEPDRRLAFLPRHFPPHVTVFASAIPGPALDALRERGWAEHDLPRASEAEVDAMVGEYLKIHARTLEAGLRHELVTAPGAKNPLFLRTVLEELRQFGSFEQLPERVRYYLEADNPKDLFRRVLSRWREDFDAKDPVQDNPKRNLVRRTLTHLWAARHGLSESEWLDLLGGLERPLPRAFWTPFFLAMEPHLSQRGGLFAYGHDFLRQAVECEFVMDEAGQHTAHAALADYFERQALSARKIAEFPWQLCQSQQMERLVKCLTLLSFFDQLFANAELDLLHYWRILEHHGYKCGEQYKRKLADGAVPTSLQLANLARFLQTHGDLAAAEELFRQALAQEKIPEFVQSTKGDNSMESAQRITDQARALRGTPAGAAVRQAMQCMNGLGEVLMQTGKYREASQLFTQALRGLDPGDQFKNVVYSNSVKLMLGAGDAAAGEGLLTLCLDEAENPFPWNPFRNDIRVPLRLALELANVKMALGKIDEAEELAQRAMDGYRQALGEDHPETLRAAHTLGLIMTRNKEYANAEHQMIRVLEARRQLFGGEHSEVLESIEGLHNLYAAKGDFAKVEELCREMITIQERTLPSEDPKFIRNLQRLAVLLAMGKHYQDAAPVFRRAMKGLVKMNLACGGRMEAEIEECAGHYVRTLRSLGMSERGVADALMSSLGIEDSDGVSESERPKSASSATRTSFTEAIAIVGTERVTSILQTFKEFGQDFDMLDHGEQDELMTDLLTTELAKMCHLCAFMNSQDWNDLTQVVDDIWVRNRLNNYKCITSDDVRRKCNELARKLGHNDISEQETARLKVNGKRAMSREEHERAVMLVLESLVQQKMAGPGGGSCGGSGRG